MSRPDYNHRTWPSPRARLVAIKLGLDITSRYPITRIKRLTHEKALELLAKRVGKTIPDFLAMPRNDVLISLGCYTSSPLLPLMVPYDPLYGPMRYW